MIGRLKNIILFWKQDISSYYRKMKLKSNTPKEKVAHLQQEIDCNKSWYGSSYGGFYVNPDLLNSQSIIYSIGIGKDITFDQKCIKNHKCKVFGFDPTPKSIDWISDQKVSELFKFYNFGISVETGTQTFFLPTNVRGVSGSLVHSNVVDSNNTIDVMMKSFNEITTELGHTHIDVLKMDIEGSEYEVLENILQSKCTITQILVEFHDRLFDTDKFRSVEIVRKLKDNGYKIFGVSGSYEEISFIKA